MSATTGRGRPRAGSDRPGAHLARLEAQAAVHAALSLPGLRLDPDHPSAPRGLVFRKPPALHVRWDSAAA